MKSVPPLDREMIHNACELRKTAASVLLSPSKSAGTGTSPVVPKGNAKNEKSSLRRTNQNPFDGRQIAMSAFPSPVKSPGTMVSVDAPNCAPRTCELELR